MTVLGSAVDWTNVLDSLILALPAIIAAIYAGRVHKQVKTPSRTSIGRQVESAHLTAIANNHLLAGSAGKTKRGRPETLLRESAQPPEVPAE
jgi:hypothetical protein